MKNIFILGPTAIGKSDLAFNYALNNNLPIVSADSVQVYRHLNIGTAKPSQEEQTKVKHYMIDIIDPDNDYSVADYYREASAYIESINRNGSSALIVGGTGFYIDALINGIFKAPPTDNRIRKELETVYKNEGVENLYKELLSIDPKTKVHINDKYRIIRALEVYKISGKTMSHFKEEHDKKKSPMGNIIVLGLEAEKKQIEQKIRLRTKKMIDAGLIEEGRSLLAMGYDSELKALKSVGYKELFLYLNNEISYGDLEEMIVKSTLSLVKKQFTWFRSKKYVTWVTNPSIEDLDRIIGD